MQVAQVLLWAIRSGAPWDTRQIVAHVRFSSFEMDETQKVWCLIALLRMRPDDVRGKVELQDTVFAAARACKILRRRLGSDLAQRVMDLVF